jgi:uncharacterized membrane protein
MSIDAISLTGDLPTWAAVIAAVLFAASLALVAWELFRHRRRAIAVASTGLLATVLLAAAVLRPVRIASRATDVGPRVVLLIDRSLSMALPGDGATRKRTAANALRSLREAHREARFSRLGFGRGAASAWDGPDDDLPTDQFHSDLAAAIASISEAADEKPSAIVVISDGRLDQPIAGTAVEQLRTTLGTIGVPIHTVSVATKDPDDASVRNVRTAGAAVAHQPIRLNVTVACTGELSCGAIPITVNELVEAGTPLPLATGVANMVDGVGTVELPITLDRAGSRVVEIAIRAPVGDTLPDNDRRLLTFDVTRDRVRILHIAGRPTYDVRAMRQWLKGDASLDVVAFFILRSLADDVNAAPSELALIRFPVEELFSEHLPSFDAVVLQDFDAVPYGLAPFLPNVKKYVTEGGGLVMVGGLHGFSAGNYAGTPLESVLPVVLPNGTQRVVDTTPFVPRYTAAGRDTPVLEALRSLYGNRLPEMSGTNVLDVPREGTVVLWEHPTLTTTLGNPMPVLALGEHGNGRVVALSVDGTHKLAFSELAADTAGRGYGAFWDALLGWLMRDPRYEPARLELEAPCRAGAPTPLRVHSVPGLEGEVQLKLIPLGSNGPTRDIDAPPRNGRTSFTVDLPPLDPGAYAVRLRVGEGPSTRHDFACERGGQEWADPRPDPEHLKAIAEATGGTDVSWDEVEKLSFPNATPVASERQVSPLLPPWVWTLAAAIALGAHWITRRRAGLA